MAENNGPDAKLVEETSKLPYKEEVRLSARRWYTLALYVAYMLCNSAQWLQYSIISGIVSRFYNVTGAQVNLTSLVMMGCYLPLALPAANFMDKISLRWTAIIGSIGTAAGAWVKVFSASPECFYITLAGQTVVAAAQVVMLSVPQKLSSTWFGEREVSTACSIGVFGFQLGIVAGFFLPPVLVKNHEDISRIGNDLYKMFLTFAIASSLVAGLVVVSFQAEPQLPPSRSQAIIRSMKSLERPSYTAALRRLFSKRRIVGLFVTTGINNGCFNGLSTLLSQIILEYHPGKEEDAGRIGVTMVIFGMAASVVFGSVLDRTKRFKLVLMIMYFMSAVAMATFTLLLVYTKSIWILYPAAAFVGTFLCGFTAISFDVATELTYPESELLVGTVMNMSSLLFTAAATLAFNCINEGINYFWGNVSFVIVLLLGAIATMPIKFKLRRSVAQGGNSFERVNGT